MIAFLLLLVIVAIVPGIAGVAGTGLLYLPFVGIVVFPGAAPAGRSAGRVQAGRRAHPETGDPR